VTQPELIAAPAERPGLLTVAREWGRIGCVGFGGPPAHIALLRQLCIDRQPDHRPRHTAVILHITWESWHTISTTDPGQMLEHEQH